MKTAEAMNVIASMKTAVGAPNSWTSHPPAAKARTSLIAVLAETLLFAWRICSLLTNDGR